MNMTGLTIREIAEILGISPSAAKFRILRAGIQPKQQAGRMNFYSEDVVDQIREVSKGGRPRKK
jgi:DNA-directed RNA polymerase specialized sigma24 family protein